MKATREYTDKEKEMIDTFLPDDFKFKKSYADITLVDGKHNMWKRIAEVKPMPERANEEEYRRDYYEFEEKSEAIEMIKYVRRKGYNQCIDEILGDQK